MYVCGVCVLCMCAFLCVCVCGIFYSLLVDVEHADEEHFKRSEDRKKLVEELMLLCVS